MITPSRRRVTIKDVATRCGVSAQTVSRVVNGRPDVAPETRARIEATIAELGYTPSAVARTLVARHSDTIGVLLAGMGYVGVVETLHGIVDASAREDLTVLIAELEAKDFQDPSARIGALIERHVDGIIIGVPAVGPIVERVKEAIPAGMGPVVFVKAGPLESFSSVGIDNVAAASDVTNHLADIGRSTIAHLAGPLEWREAQDRLTGWRAAIQARDLDAGASLVAAGDWSPSSGSIGMARLLDSRPDLDAVFVANDRMAMGALHLLRQRKLRVPDDIAVAGFDDIPEAAFTYPALTSVRQPLEAMGHTAIDLIRTHLLESEGAIRDVTLETELVVRASTVPSVVPTSTTP